MSQALESLIRSSEKKKNRSLSLARGTHFATGRGCVTSRILLNASWTLSWYRSFSMSSAKDSLCAVPSLRRSSFRASPMSLRVDRLSALTRFSFFNAFFGRLGRGRESVDSFYGPMVLFLGSQHIFVKLVRELVPHRCVVRECGRLAVSFFPVGNKSSPYVKFKSSVIRARRRL